MMNGRITKNGKMSSSTDYFLRFPKYVCMDTTENGGQNIRFV